MILDSDHSRVRLQYAEMLVEVDQLSLAEEQLNRILENNSSYSPAYNDLGVLYRYWGNLVKAMEYFGTAFDLDNKNYKALENMLSLAGQLGLADQAKGILQEIITKEGPLPILIDLEKKLGNAHPA
jgi:tetratricopeptide (TPR) repeat protein